MSGDVSQTAAAPPQRPSRGDVLRQTRRRMQDEVFAGHTYEIISEVHLPPGQVYQTRFGNKGRKGYIIRDTESGEQHVVGKAVLRNIAERYHGVTLPPTLRRTRTPRQTNTE